MDETILPQDEPMVVRLTAVDALDSNARWIACYQLWEAARLLATARGWEPAGTIDVRCNGQYCEDCGGVHDVHEWDGGYEDDHGQLITGPDARAFAEALAPALAELPDTDDVIVFATALQRIMGAAPSIDIVYSLMIGNNIEHLGTLVGLCTRWGCLRVG